MEYKKPTTYSKFKKVVCKNTFYFYNPTFEDQYEGHLNLLKETLLVLRNDIETKGFKKDLFEELLIEKEHGLNALLALTGLSNETLKRLTTIVRIVDDPELSKLAHKDKWYKNEDVDNVKEWSNAQIGKLIKENKHFRKGIVNIFFTGSTTPFLAKTIPLFELKKLSISKLKFELPAMLDTIIRYKEKGSYSGIKKNNPEILIEYILNELEIPFERGDLPELIDGAPYNKRAMDFIIPNKRDPLIIVESSFLATTSSGQGDKSKTEISMGPLIKSHYPKGKFIGFIDGIGWYVRKNDLRRMVSAYEDVFTYHREELERFKKLLIKTF